MPKFYWTVIATARWAPASRASTRPDGWIRVSIDDVPFGYPDDKIDAVIDAADQLPAKIAALRAHATQVTVAPKAVPARCPTTSRCRSADEHYILVSGEPGDRDHRGWETDLLPD